MLRRSTYRILHEPQRQVYEALVRFCADHCHFGMLVDLFPGTKAGKAARASFLAGAEGSIRSVELVERWPLTEPQSGSLGKPVPAWTFDLDDRMVEVLTRCRGLYAWHAPKFPEDLAFYREDGSLLLGTVAHEHIGWLNLSQEEAANVRRVAVELQAEL